jgi:predicted transcriptional regulator
VLGRGFDGVSKHLRLLREAGVIFSQPAKDRRFELYYIPQSIRRADGVFD